MSDESFRPRRPQSQAQDNMNYSDSSENVQQTFDAIEGMRQQAQNNSEQIGQTPVNMPQREGGMQVKGNIPPQFQQALQSARNQNTEPKQPFAQRGTSNENIQNHRNKEF